MVLATCAKDLKFYSWPEISLLGVYETTDDGTNIKSLSWDSDGSNVIIVKGNGHPVLLKAPVRIEENIQPRISIKYSGITVATFSNNNSNVLAFGSSNGDVKLYDIKEKETASDYRKLPGVIQNLEFLKSDVCLVAGCTNGQVVIYNRQREPCVSLVVPFSTSLTTIATHKQYDNLLAAASKEGVMSVWDVEKSENKLTARHHTGVITDVAFNGDAITSVSVDQNFITYDIREARQTACYNLNSPLSGVSYLNNTHEIAISTCDGQLRSYDFRFMTSPLHTVVAYNSWIRKISFPHSRVTSHTPSIRHRFSERNDFPIEESSPASGDYSLHGRDINKDNYSEANSNDLIRSISEVLYNNIDEKFTTEDLSDLVKDVEKQIKIRKNEYEEKLLQKFYMLRIDGSKQFITLEEQVNDSWKTFIEYLKYTGGSKRERAKSRATSSRKC